MPTLHHAAGGAKRARMKANQVTPAEAKAVWHLLGKPSTRKVAEWFKTTGRPVRYETIGDWQQAGWPGVSVTDFARAAGVAMASVVRIASAQNGDKGLTKTEMGESNGEARGAKMTYAPADVMETPNAPRRHYARRSLARHRSGRGSATSQPLSRASAQPATRSRA